MITRTRLSLSRAGLKRRAVAWSREAAATIRCPNFTQRCISTNLTKVSLAEMKAAKTLSFKRSFSHVRLETETEEIGRLVPMGLKAIYSSHNTFSQGEIVVINHPDGEHFFGRVESGLAKKNSSGVEEYEVAVDETGKIRLIPAAEIGKIVSTGDDAPHKSDNTYKPPARLRDAHVNSMQQYQKMYHESLENPDAFWGGISENFHWHTKWNKLNDVNFDCTKGPVKIEWFLGGKTNLTYNCVDRHVQASNGDRMAFIWEGNDGERKDMTYKQLLDAVCKFANGLKSLGVKKGDLVSLYMPMVLELPVAMLACARIGAVHSVIFAGFSAEALAARILDSKSKVLITADGVRRGPKLANFMEIVDTAVAHAKEQGHTVDHTVVVQRMGDYVIEVHDKKLPGMIMWNELVSKQSSECPVEWLDSEDPCFVLYTSGSTGKPKGALHTTAGYMVWAATTFKYVFDYKPNDVYWCTADCGWITGHSYITYGPTCNGATQVLFEGVPSHPSPARCWEIIERHKVAQFYTAPTAIRALIAYGEEVPAKHNLKSLKVLGSVGEPISPETWKWYHQHIGGSQTPIVDTWWQTETGGHMLTPLPGATPLKPGSATLPFFGVEPVVLDPLGNEVTGPCEGYLAIKRSWPGQLRGVLGDQKRFESTYFTLVNAQNAIISRDKYIAGDAVRRDEDGYYWITGRIDDVINVSGHRIGTAEVESALVMHPLCTEAAVVGYPHPVKGESIYAYVALVGGQDMTSAIEKELKDMVRKEIGPFAAPEIIHGTPGLPKTRSGKIMRRILRRIAAAGKATKIGDLGDLSTLAEPGVVPNLIATAKNNAK